MQLGITSRKSFLQAYRLSSCQILRKFKIVTHPPPTAASTQAPYLPTVPSPALLPKGNDVSVAPSLWREDVLAIYCCVTSHPEAVVASNSGLTISPGPVGWLSALAQFFPVMSMWWWADSSWLASSEGCTRCQMAPTCGWCWRLLWPGSVWGSRPEHLLGSFL